MPIADIILDVEGMTCGHCARAVKELAEEVEGVASATVDLESKKVRVSLNAFAVSAQTIIDNINSSNSYKARLS